MEVRLQLYKTLVKPHRVLFAVLDVTLREGCCLEWSAVVIKRDWIVWVYSHWNIGGWGCDFTQVYNIMRDIKSIFPGAGESSTRGQSERWDSGRKWYGTETCPMAIESAVSLCSLSASDGPNISKLAITLNPLQRHIWKGLWLEMLTLFLFLHFLSDLLGFFPTLSFLIANLKNLQFLFYSRRFFKAWVWLLNQMGLAMITCIMKFSFIGQPQEK